MLDVQHRQFDRGAATCVICGDTHLVKFDEDVSDVLDKIPAQLKVISRLKRSRQCLAPDIDDFFFLTASACQCWMSKHRQFDRGATTCLICAGTHLIKFDEDVSDVLDRIPAQLKVILPAKALTSMSGARH